jgi:hypothetical protein
MRAFGRLAVRRELIPVVAHGRFDSLAIAGQFNCRQGPLPKIARSPFQPTSDIGEHRKRTLLLLYVLPLEPTSANEVRFLGQIAPACVGAPIAVYW